MVCGHTKRGAIQESLYSLWLQPIQKNKQKRQKLVHMRELGFMIMLNYLSLAEVTQKQL